MCNTWIELEFPPEAKVAAAASDDGIQPCAHFNRRSTVTRRFMRVECSRFERQHASSRKYTRHLVRFPARHFLSVSKRRAAFDLRADECLQARETSPIHSNTQSADQLSKRVPHNLGSIGKAVVNVSVSTWLGACLGIIVECCVDLMSRCYLHP